MGTSAQINNPYKKHVIFFDGFCNLCNSSVDFILRKDSEQKFLFDSLQSDIASKTLSPSLPKDIDSIVVWKSSGELLVKSSAGLFIASQLGGWLNIFIIFKILPSSLRDALYMLIARNRYRWFGKKSTCRIPTANERARFLEAYQNN